jgi:hypothetical protein
MKVNRATSRRASGEGNSFSKEEEEEEEDKAIDSCEGFHGDGDLCA